MNAVIALALVVTLVGLALLPRRELHGPAARLFSSLLPSWRFFEQVEPAPELFYRVAASGAEAGDWCRALHPPKRGVAALLFNPDGNLALACHALLEQLLSDIATAEIRDGEVAARLVSYRLVQQLVVHALPPELARDSTLELQFKLTLEDAGDVLVSGVFTLGSSRA